MTLDATALHPEIAAAGAAIGALALLVDRPRPGFAAVVAGIGVAGYLAAIDQVPLALPLLLLAIAFADRLHGRGRVVLLAAAGAGLVVVRPELPAGARAALAFGLLVVLVTGSVRRPDRHHLVLWALVATCSAATFLGGPDTEAAVAAGAALGLALLARRDPAAPLPLAALALATWIAVDAYRGRPAGLPAAAIAIAAVAMVGLLGPWERRSVALVAATAIIAANAARTIGADTTIAAGAAAGAVAVAAVLLGTAVWVGRVSDPPGPARTPAG